jgi:hypothetical protein
MKELFGTIVVEPATERFREAPGWTLLVILEYLGAWFFLSEAQNEKLAWIAVPFTAFIFYFAGDSLDKLVFPRPEEGRGWTSPFLFDNALSDARAKVKTKLDLVGDEARTGVGYYKLCQTLMKTFKHKARFSAYWCNEGGKLARSLVAPVFGACMALALTRHWQWLFGALLVPPLLFISYCRLKAHHMTIVYGAAVSLLDEDGPTKPRGIKLMPSGTLLIFKGGEAAAKDLIGLTWLEKRPGEPRRSVRSWIVGSRALTYKQETDEQQRVMSTWKLKAMEMEVLTERPGPPAGATAANHEQLPDEVLVQSDQRQCLSSNGNASGGQQETSVRS